MEKAVTKHCKAKKSTEKSTEFPKNSVHAAPFAWGAKCMEFHQNVKFGFVSHDCNSGIHFFQIFPGIVNILRLPRLQFRYTFFSELSGNSPCGKACCAFGTPRGGRNMCRILQEFCALRPLIRGSKSAACKCF